MNKKVLLITLIALVALLAIAGVLYPKLSSGMQTQQLATTPPATTEVADATEATQPETIPAPDFTALDWDGNEVNFSDSYSQTSGCPYALHNLNRDHIIINQINS